MTNQKSIAGTERVYHRSLAGRRPPPYPFTPHSSTSPCYPFHTLLLRLPFQYTLLLSLLLLLYTLILFTLLILLTPSSSPLPPHLLSLTHHLPSPPPPSPLHLSHPSPPTLPQDYQTTLTMLRKDVDVPPNHDERQQTYSAIGCPLIASGNGCDS